MSFSVFPIFILHIGTDLKHKQNFNYHMNSLKIQILKFRLISDSYITHFSKSQILLKRLSSHCLILNGFFFLKQTFLQIFRLLWYANALPDISTSQTLQSPHRPQPMGKFAREIWQATGWESWNPYWLCCPQTNVDFVAIPETNPLDVPKKQLFHHPQSWGCHAEWLRQQLHKGVKGITHSFLFQRSVTPANAPCWWTVKISSL